MEWVQSGDCKIYAVSREGDVRALAEDRVKPLDDRVLSRWVEEFGQSRPGGFSRNRSAKTCGKTAHGETDRGAIP